MQHSLAVRRIGTDPVEFTVLRSAKAFLDCDGNGRLSGPPWLDAMDQDNADVVAYTFTNPGGTGAFTATGSKTVSVNSAGVCDDRGLTSTRYHGGDTWSCYTHHHQGAPDKIDVTSCNSTVGATATAWVDEFDLPAPPIGSEDHPSVDFIDSERIVATSNRDPSDHHNDQVRIHFPDHAGPNPIINVTGAQWANHPVVDVSPVTGLAQMVWHRDSQSDAEADLLYSKCQTSPTVRCDTGSQWDPAGVLSTGNGEKFPQIAADGGFTMIVYTADDPTILGTQYRVYAKWRCGANNGWTTEIIRTNTDQSQHQSMAYGRPGLVLNNVANVAHVVLFDGLNRQETDDPANTNANLYWYRKPYVCAL